MWSKLNSITTKRIHDLSFFCGSLDLHHHSRLLRSYFTYCGIQKNTLRTWVIHGHSHGNHHSRNRQIRPRARNRVQQLNLLYHHITSNHLLSRLQPQKVTLFLKFCNCRLPWNHRHHHWFSVNNNLSDIYQQLFLPSSDSHWDFAYEFSAFCDWHCSSNVFNKSKFKNNSAWKVPCFECSSVRGGDYQRRSGNYSVRHNFQLEAWLNWRVVHVIMFSNLVSRWLVRWHSTFVTFSFSAWPLVFSLDSV